MIKPKNQRLPPLPTRRSQLAAAVACCSGCWPPLCRPRHDASQINTNDDQAVSGCYWTCYWVTSSKHPQTDDLQIEIPVRKTVNSLYPYSTLTTTKSMNVPACKVKLLIVENIKQCYIIHVLTRRLCFNTVASPGGLAALYFQGVKTRNPPSLAVSQFRGWILRRTRTSKASPSEKLPPNTVSEGRLAVSQFRDCILRRTSLRGAFELGHPSRGIVT